MVLTIICLFGGAQETIPYEYSTETVLGAGDLRTAAPFFGLNVSAFETVPNERVHVDSREMVMRVVRRIEKEVSSLPMDFWGRHRLAENEKNKVVSDCAVLPSVLDLEYSNEYWQRQRTSNGTFELFGAYLDNRKAIEGGDQFVRVLGMVDRMSVSDSVQMYCQLWYDNLESSYIVPLENYNYIWHKEWVSSLDDQLQPYLMSCRLPPEMRNTVPAAVSLVENKCDLATNLLRVIYNKPVSQQPPQGFAVCVKGLDFLEDDLSVRLVEWIELLSLLGADKIYFYDLQVHPNIREVLAHYESEGRVHVQKAKLPGGKPNVPGLQHMFLKDNLNLKRKFELIPYNDCLYRNMYRYKYITLLDIDEVIMPNKSVHDWSQLMHLMRDKASQDEGPQKTFTSFSFRNIYFLDRFYTSKQKGQAAEFDLEVPEYMHMLRHTSRAKEYTEWGFANKCFHRSDLVLTLHNHFAVECLTGYCHAYDVSEKDAQLNHYRKECSSKCKVAEQFVEDATIDKYKTKLIKRSLSTMLQLGLVRPKR